MPVVTRWYRVEVNPLPVPGKVWWEDAAKNAVETAANSLRDLRVAEGTKLDMKIEDGKVIAYRARVSLSFKYDG